jgi:iron-sulfur cluster repair protein YtfE (RIC family)
VPPAPGQAQPPVRADQTVADVAQLRAGALETMKALGINHCCGAHLTLSEAAAAAGVPLDALLAALNEPQEARA